MGYQFQLSDLMALISVALMVLGVRLLRIAARNRSAPELLMGFYLLLSPPSTSLVMRIDRFPPEYHRLLENLGYPGLAIASLCLCAFAWRVFRPDSRWAEAAVALFGAVFLWMLLQVTTGAASMKDQAASLAARVVMLLTYVWVFVECVLQYRMLVRRMRLGLADPVVVNRFLLFAIWSGVLGVLPGIILMVAFLVDAGEVQPSGGLFSAVMRITGILIYGTIWLSFLPPKSYTRWLQRRNALAGAEA
jgi:hypothetical protein